MLPIDGFPIPCPDLLLGAGATVTVAVIAVAAFNAVLGLHDVVTE